MIFIKNACCMGAVLSWDSAPTEDSLGLQVYGVKFLKPYTICCGYCCADKPDKPDEKVKTYGCRQCPAMYYCSRKCSWDDSEIHIESHRRSSCGELVIKIAAPSKKCAPLWTRPIQETLGVRFVNAGTGAIRITLPDRSLKILVQSSKAKIVSATESEQLETQ
jgi:hypothetical protein